MKTTDVNFCNSIARALEVRRTINRKEKNFGDITVIITKDDIRDATGRTNVHKTIIKEYETFFMLLANDYHVFRNDENELVIRLLSKIPLKRKYHSIANLHYSNTFDK